jgi:hypothetical protein
VCYLLCIEKFNGNNRHHIIKGALRQKPSGLISKYVPSNQRHNSNLVIASDDSLLVVARGLIIGINDGVRRNTVGVVRLSPGVDGVDVSVGVDQHGENGEHLSAKAIQKVSISE